MDRNQGRALSGVNSPALSLRLLRGDAAETAALQNVLESAHHYYEAVFGAPPGPDEAQSLFASLPPGKDGQDKYVWGLYAGVALVGCADVIRGYPVSNKAVIGLLLLGASWQGHGLGRQFAGMIEGAIGEWREILHLRIGVALTNPRALAFWQRVGFVATGEVKFAEPGHIRVTVLEKPVAGTRAHE